MEELDRGESGLESSVSNREARLQGPLGVLEQTEAHNNKVRERERERERERGKRERERLFLPTPKHTLV